jgi:signal transduction histidine kinase
VTRLTALVSDLMDVTRIIAGKLPLRPEEVELDALVRDVVARFEPASRAPISVVAAPVRAVVDASRIDQVITNLVSNAVKYGDGKPIAVTVQEDEGRAQIAVRDRGVGITPEERVHIFDRFVRAPRTAHIAGLGLGLFIVKEIVEAHDGAITVDGAPGEGSTFTVSLPLSVVEPGA